VAVARDSMTRILATGMWQCASDGCAS